MIGTKFNTTRYWEITIFSDHLDNNPVRFDLAIDNNQIQIVEYPDYTITLA